MIIAVTGHRPGKLGGYSRPLLDLLADFATLQLGQIRPSGVITGMALGWDTAVAVACVRLRLPFVAAIPFEGQESKWPKQSQEDYRNLLLCADQVYPVAGRGNFETMVAQSGLEAAVVKAMHARDEWMVDHSHGLLALWNGDRTGGTYHTVKYAKEGRRDITNVWTEWDTGAFLV